VAIAVPPPFAASVTIDVPADDGAPEINPVAVSIDKPDGSTVAL
jgi:hypothetical protein